MIRAGRRCPPGLVTTPSIICCSSWSRSGSSTCDELCRLGAARAVTGSAPRSCATKYGFISTPSFATAPRRSLPPAAGSSATSRWPNAVWASAALSSRSCGRPDRRRGDPERHVELCADSKPNAWPAASTARRRSARPRVRERGVARLGQREVQGAVAPFSQVSPPKLCTHAAAPLAGHGPLPPSGQ